MAKLILVRGVSGAGKTTIAKHLVKNGIVDCHFEADDYLMVNGVFLFHYSLLNDAHKSCFDQTCAALKENKNVVVANTFVKRSEMQQYVEYVKNNGHELEIIVAKGNYVSTRRVPERTIQRMRDKWED